MDLPCFHIKDRNFHSNPQVVPVRFECEWFIGDNPRCFDKDVKKVIDTMPGKIKDNFPEAVRGLIKGLKMENISVEGKITVNTSHQYRIDDKLFSALEFREIISYFHEPILQDDTLTVVSGTKPQSTIVKDFCDALVSDEFTLGNRCLVFENARQAIQQFEECITLFNFQITTIIKNEKGADIVWWCKHSFISGESVPWQSNQWEFQGEKGGSVELFATLSEALEKLR